MIVDFVIPLHVLKDLGVSKDILKLRARAMKKLGTIFQMGIHVAELPNVTCEKLHFKSDSSVAISWVTCLESIPWKQNDVANSIVNNLGILNSMNIETSFSLIPRSANTIADSLAKSGVHRSSPLEAWF